MTDNVNKFNAARRNVGYRSGMQAFKPVNLAEAFNSRGIVFNGIDEMFGAQNEK